MQSRFKEWNPKGWKPRGTGTCIHCEREDNIGPRNLCFRCYTSRKIRPLYTRDASYEIANAIERDNEERKINKPRADGLFHCIGAPDCQNLVEPNEFQRMMARVLKMFWGVCPKCRTEMAKIHGDDEE